MVGWAGVVILGPDWGMEIIGTSWGFCIASMVGVWGVCVGVVGVWEGVWGWGSCVIGVRDLLFGVSDSESSRIRVGVMEWWWQGEELIVWGYWELGVRVDGEVCLGGGIACGE